MFYHALTGGNTPTGDLSPVLLWENSSPTTAFTAQTISLNLTDYAGVIVEFYYDINNQYVSSRVYAKKTDVFSNKFGAGFIAENANAINILALNNNGIQFGNASPNTTACIPYKIYGVKEYVVEPVVGDLLWHNDNPTEALAAKEIAGDYSKYSKIYVECKVSTTVNYESVLILEKNDTYSPGLVNYNTAATTLNYRTMFFSDSNLRIDDGTTINNLGQSRLDNTSCIVTNIYGIE